MKKSNISIRNLALTCLLLLGFVACNKDQDVPPTHEMTEEEQKKQHVEDSFTVFAEAINMEDSTNAWDYLLNHSDISLGLNGSLIYSLNQDGVMLLWLKFRFMNPDRYKIDGTLHGGLALKGYIHPLSMILDTPGNRERHLDIHVIDNGEDVAKLGLEYYDGKLIPVFRFYDGTSYSVSTVILIAPLLDYLLKYVLSTE